MASLDSALTPEDLQTLIEAMNDWETIGNSEYMVMNHVKSMPMPPEDHEAFEYIKQVKEMFAQREKDIKTTRELRMEKAIFVKAKLMLAKRDQGISKLFAEASNPVIETTPQSQPLKEMTAEDKTKLELAEYFIRDLGVWKNYCKFLEERSVTSS